jgi:hypothetical protein
VVHAAQLLRHVLVEEKATLVGIVYEIARQRPYQQPYQLSLTLQFRLHARNEDAANFSEAEQKNEVVKVNKVAQPYMWIWKFCVVGHHDNPNNTETTA